jgi:outer membrane protein assembly factor BamB
VTLRLPPYALVLAALLAACGRSPLDGPRLAPAPLSSNPPPGVPLAPPLSTARCPARLMQGSPSPTASYCPTRAGQSDFEAPPSPSWLWSLQLPGTPLPDDPLIIAPGGRLFVRVDTNDVDAAWIPRRLVAVERGEVVFHKDFSGAIAGPPWLASDGTLRLLLSGAGERVLTTLSLGGELLASASLPASVRGDPVVGPDGSFHFLLMPSSDQPASVLAVGPEGIPRWTSAPLGRFPSPLALGRDGRLLVGSYEGAVKPGGYRTKISALAPDGALSWETVLDEEAYLVNGPVVGRDGAVHAALWTEATTKTTLITLEPSGTIRWKIDAQEPPWGGGSTGLWVGDEGGIYLKAGQAFLAFDAQGKDRWRRDAHPNVLLGCTLDARGTVLISSGAIEALDPLTGQTLWVSEEPPAEPSPLFFAGGATLGEGALFFSDFGGKLHAVGAF